MTDLFRVRAHGLTVTYKEEGQEMAFSQEDSSVTSKATGISPLFNVMRTSSCSEKDDSIG